MADWVSYVRERLRLPHLLPEREAEIVEDVAQQLEEAYRRALNRGTTESAACTEAENEIPNWAVFASEVTASERRNALDAETRVQQRMELKSGGGITAMWRDMGSDLLHGFRLLRKNPGFSLLAILTLALGISANATMFSLVDTLLLRPLPVERPNELVAVQTKDSRSTFSFNLPLSYPNYEDLRASTKSFSAAIAETPTQLSLKVGETPELSWAEFASGDYFRMLGVQPAIGRFFDATDDRSGSPLVAVLSHTYWQRRFGGATNVVGQVIQLNGKPATIIGVAPKGFNGLEVIFSPNLWVPLRPCAEQAYPGGKEMLALRSEVDFRMWARLKPGVTFDQAASELNVQGDRLAKAYPDTNKGVTFVMFPSWEARIEPGTGRIFAIAGAMLMAVVGLVLLIACANVANLMLARAIGRQKEVAVRLALGASRGRLVRQFLAEGLLLSLAGAVGAAVLASFAAQGLTNLLRVQSFPILNLDFHIDARAMLFTGGLAFFTTLLCSLAPALRATRPNLVPSLKGDEVTFGDGDRRFGLRNVLVVAQVALSLMLLVLSGLFLQTMLRAQEADLGIRKTGGMLASMNLTIAGYDEPRGRAFSRDLLARARAIPGVASAGLAYAVPLDFNAEIYDVVVEGRQTEPGKEKIQLMGTEISTGFLQTAGTPLVDGRDFTEMDSPDSQHVVIVNETAAKMYWPGKSAIGQRIFTKKLTSSDSAIVVGIAKTGKYRMYFEEPQPFIYLPMEQHYKAAMTLILHSQRDMASLLPELRREVAAIDSNLPIYGVRSMESFLAERTFAGPRLLSILLTVFGGVGLLLATVGVYGVMAYWVGRRTREIGIRMALGAQGRDVLRMVIGQGARLTLVGVAAGLVGAFLLSRAVAILLFGVKPHDPATYLGICALLLSAALLACYIPARRAVRVDPMKALRYE